MSQVPEPADGVVVAGWVDGLGGAAGDRGSHAARSVGHMRAAWATRHRGLPGGWFVGWAGGGVADGIGVRRRRRVGRGYRVGRRGLR